MSVEAWLCRVDKNLFVSLSIDHYHSILGQIFYLSQLLLREELLKSQVCAPHKLEPFRNLELFLHHSVASVGKPVSPIMATPALAYHTLKTQFDASEEAIRYLCKAATRFI